MTKLDCTVQNCLYNKENCCCKDNIQVEGNHARHSHDTCCTSFREGKHYAVNSVDIPTKDTNVLCQATECTFNSNCHCEAKHIGISGKNACDCRETECATFRCKCE